MGSLLVLDGGCPNKMNMPAVGSSFDGLKNQLHLVSVNLFTSIAIS